MKQESEIITSNKTKIQINEKAILIVSDKVKEKIKFLCNKFKELEWSGLIWMDIVGSVEDPRTMQITVIDFTLLDIGTKAYTEYEIDPVLLMNIYDKYPDYITKKYGCLHSHNSFGVFFSGTDTSTLLEEAFIHNFFVSLIVNNALDLVCKVSYKGEKEIESKETFYNRIGNIMLPYFRESKKKEDVVYVIDVDTSFESPEVIYEDVELTEQIKACQVRKANEKKAFQSTYPQYHPHQYNKRQHKGIILEDEKDDDWGFYKQSEDQEFSEIEQHLNHAPKQLSIGFKSEPKNFESSVNTFRDKCETLVKRLLICDYGGEQVVNLTLEGAKALHKEDYEDTAPYVFIEEVDEICEMIITPLFETELKANYQDDVNFKKLRTMISSQCVIFLDMNNYKERGIFESIDQELKNLDNIRNESQRNSRSL